MSTFEYDTFSWTSWVSSPEDETEVRDIMRSLPINSIVEGCKQRRNGIECEIVPDRWASGSQNFVLQLRFVDGVRWVIKTTRPSHDSQSTYSNPEPYLYEPFLRYMREVDAMKFLRLYTDLPVPEPQGILFFEAEDSLLACACLMMDFVAGISGREFFSEGIWNKDLDQQEKLHQAQERILRSLARIQVTLAKFQSSEIGYLERRKGGLEGGLPVAEGFEVANGASSYQAPADCYQSLLAHRKAKADGQDPDSPEGKTARQMLNVMGSTLPYVCQESHQSYLTLVDNGGHNIVCDREGNLVSLIDIDTLWFAPIEIAAQIPSNIHLRHSFDDSPLRWRPNDQTKSGYLAQYADLIRQAGIELKEPQVGDLLASKMLHYSAVVVAGLFTIREGESNVHKDWLRTQRIARLHWLNLGSLQSTPPAAPGNNTAEEEEEYVEATVDAAVGLALDVKPEDARAPEHQRDRDFLRFLVTGEGSMPREILAKLPQLVGETVSEEEGPSKRSAEQRQLRRLIEACNGVGS